MSGNYQRFRLSFAPSSCLSAISSIALSAMILACHFVPACAGDPRTTPRVDGKVLPKIKDARPDVKISPKLPAEAWKPKKSTNLSPYCLTYARQIVRQNKLADKCTLPNGRNVALISSDYPYWWSCTLSYCYQNSYDSCITLLGRGEKQKMDKEISDREQFLRKFDCIK